MLHGPQQQRGFLIVSLCVLGVLCVGRGAARRAARSTPDGGHPAAGRRSAERIGLGPRDSRRASRTTSPNQTVELHVGSDVLKTKTDAEGRAQFDKLAPGADAEGRRRRRRRAPRVAGSFRRPAQGGIRLAAARGGRDAAGAAPAPAGPPPSPGRSPSADSRGSSSSRARSPSRCTTSSRFVNNSRRAGESADALCVRHADRRRRGTGDSAGIVAARQRQRARASR